LEVRFLRRDREKVGILGGKGVFRNGTEKVEPRAVGWIVQDRVGEVNLEKFGCVRERKRAAICDRPFQKYGSSSCPFKKLPDGEWTNESDDFTAVMGDR
jgi:hypothetical protein